MSSGQIVGLHRAATRGGPMESLKAATVVTDRGIDGDHHQRWRSSRQVMLAESEILECLGLSPGDIREQVTLQGAGLAAGDILVVGEVRLEVVKPRVPCKVMDEIRPGLKNELRGRAGWCARALHGGSLHMGARVAKAKVDDPTWITDFLAALAAYESSPDRGPRGGRSLTDRLAGLTDRNEALVRTIEEREQHEQTTSTPTDLDVLYRLHDSSATALVDAARRVGAAARPHLEAAANEYRALVAGLSDSQLIRG